MVELKVQSSLGIFGKKSSSMMHTSKRNKVVAEVKYCHDESRNELMILFLSHI